MPPEFFRPAGPERRSRPEFEQRLYQTAISAKLSAEWQTGPGISPRKAGRKVLFCQKRRGDQAAEGGGFSRKGRPTEPLRNDTASSSRRHAGRDSADTKAVVRTERQRKEVRRRATGYRRRTTNGKRWTMDGATGDGQQAARGWTAMDGDGRRAEEVRNGGRKTRRNTDAGGRTDKAGELPAERATGRGSYGQRELRAGKRKT